MSVKIAAIYQPEGCRVSVPASAMCARSPHLALIFAIPDGLDKTDLESWRRSMSERRMGMSKYGRRARAPSPDRLALAMATRGKGGESAPSAQAWELRRWRLGRPAFTASLPKYLRP